MKKQFITVRFDRMKNIYLKALIEELLKSIIHLKNDIPELKLAHSNLKKHENITQVLSSAIIRKKPYTAQITKLRKHNDKLTAAIQFHFRALTHAQFEDDAKALKVLNIQFKKLFENYKTSTIAEKKTTHLQLNMQINQNEAFKNALTQLGFMRFVNKINDNNNQLKQYESTPKTDSRALSAPHTTQPIKDKLLSEMRLYMRFLEMYFQLHPETDEKDFINHTNIVLKEARKQLRNTTTRRIRKKAKEAKEEEQKTQSEIKDEA